MDRHTQSRLKNENAIWIVTAGRDLQPQAVPVWFYFDGSSFLIYAQPGIKVRHVRENPHVELHLNTDDAGEDLVRVSGDATVLKSLPPASKAAGYVRKYRSQIKKLGMTVEDFMAQYHYPIRVRRLRFH